MGARQADGSTGVTQLFAIVGDPIAQVRSPEVFNGLFKARGLDAVMVPMHVDADDLATLLEGLRATRNVAGVVITVPHKMAAAALMRSGSERVRVAGATNALRPCEGGWDGDLFDGEGFAIGLRAEHGSLAGKTCSIVGAGGAGAAIALALAERGVASISVWDTDAGRATALAVRLATASPTPVSVREPDGSTDIAVNATPLGMGDDDPLPMSLDDLRADALVAEAVMKPPMTRLLLEAQRRGHPIQQGRHMLDSQVESIWRFFGLP